MKSNFGMRPALRKVKASGASAESIWKVIEMGRREAAAKDGWRQSELIACLCDDLDAIEEVYGKRARRRIDQQRAQKAVGAS